jgi:hypothetical protein
MIFLRTCALLAFAAFGLHFVWEFSHVQLYAGYEGWSRGLPVYWLATVGDVLYTLAAFALVSAIKQTYAWVRDANVADYLMLVTLGFLTALFVEYKGLFFERWHYLPDMPIIPLLNVGLSPVLQMSLLLPLTVFLTALVLKLTDRRT